jgi:magnesium transporter
MITACLSGHQSLILQEITEDNKNLIQQALWIDLLFPTKQEEKLVQSTLKIELPTQDEMHEIEPSSRFYKENSEIYMTAAILAQSETEPKIEPITFILNSQCLITIRYVEPNSFKAFKTLLKKTNSDKQDAYSLFVTLLDSTIDRLADVLEIVGHQIDDFSRMIFKLNKHKSDAKLDYQELLKKIGYKADVTTKARESLITFNRLITYFSKSIQSAKQDNHKDLNILSRDVIALSDHANFLTTKIAFMLDAILGLVNIEQNNIIKIFSVAAVMFLPPTLIASMYGMNFHFMPELSWKYGYLFAVGIMIGSAIIPYIYFKKRKWL